jgi:hypothetical protein
LCHFRTPTPRHSRHGAAQDAVTASNQGHLDGEICLAFDWDRWDIDIDLERLLRFGAVNP